MYIFSSSYNRSRFYPTLWLFINVLIQSRSLQCRLNTPVQLCVSCVKVCSFCMICSVRWSCDLFLVLILQIDLKKAQEIAPDDKGKMAQKRCDFQCPKYFL